MFIIYRYRRGNEWIFIYDTYWSMYKPWSACLYLKCLFPYFICLDSSLNNMFTCGLRYTLYNKFIKLTFARSIRSYVLYTDTINEDKYMNSLAAYIIEYDSCLLGWTENQNLMINYSVEQFTQIKLRASTNETRGQRRNEGLPEMQRANQCESLLLFIQAIYSCYLFKLFSYLFHVCSIKNQ
jgi:hypothetical protein